MVLSGCNTLFVSSRPFTLPEQPGKLEHLLQDSFVLINYDNQTTALYFDFDRLQNYNFTRYMRPFFFFLNGNNIFDCY